MTFAAVVELFKILISGREEKVLPNPLLRLVYVVFDVQVQEPEEF